MLRHLALIAVDPKARTVNLSHGPIAALGWPAMTMDFGVAEGVATAPAIVERAAQVGVELPICAAVADLLAGELTVGDAMGRLLARPRRDE